MKKISDFIGPALIDNFEEDIFNYQLTDPNFIGFQSNETMEMVYQFALKDVKETNILDLNCLRGDLQHYINVNYMFVTYQGVNLREDAYDSLRQMKYTYVNSDNIAGETVNIFIDSDAEKFETSVLDSEFLNKLTTNKLIILIKDDNDYPKLITQLKTLGKTFSIEFHKFLNFIKIVIE